jgi:hypothetical protein
MTTGWGAAGMMAEDKARTGRQDGGVVGRVAAFGWSSAAQRWTAGAGAGHRSPQAARGAMAWSWC